MLFQDHGSALIPHTEDTQDKVGEWPANHAHSSLPGCRGRLANHRAREGGKGKTLRCLRLVRAMKCGGVPTQPTYDHQSRARKRSTIVVFVGLLLFDDVVRPLVTDISPLLQDARLMDDEFGMPSALAATSLDEQVLNSVTAQLVATWFSILIRFQSFIVV